MGKSVLFTVYNSKLKRIFNSLTQDLLAEVFQLFEDRYDRECEFDDVGDTIQFEAILSELLEKRLLELMESTDNTTLPLKERNIAAFLLSLLAERDLPTIGVSDVKISREYGMLLLNYET